MTFYLMGEGREAALVTCRKREGLIRIGSVIGNCVAWLR